MTLKPRGNQRFSFTVSYSYESSPDSIGEDEFQVQAGDIGSAFYEALNRFVAKNVKGAWIFAIEQDDS